ncbi:hypothetical protein HK101_011100 [Irineochytrium annulatum]|nr:hypothetical protein HK101_011100 [Irineochytrium annulatum]
MDSRARSATTTAAPFYLRPTDLAAGERTPRTKLDVDLMFKDLFDELEAARLEHDPAAESGDAGQNGEHFAHGAAVVTPGSAITRRPSKATVPNIRRAKSSAAVLTVGTSTRAVAMGSTPAPVVKGQFPSPRHSNEPGDQPLASSEPGLRIDADGLPGSQSARTPSPPMNESLSWSATATPILPASTILSRGRSTTTTAALTTNCRPSDINLLTSRSRSATTTAEPDPSALVNVSAMDLMDFYTPALTTVTAKRLTPNLRITTTLASITNLKFARPVNATPPVRDVTAPGGPINVPSRGSSLAPVDPPQGPSFAAAIGRPRAATDAAAPDQSTRWIRARAFTVSEDSIGACGAGKAAVRAATTTTTETSAGAVGVRPFDLSAAAGEFVSARPRQGVAGLQLRVGRIGGRLGRAGGR